MSLLHIHAFGRGQHFEVMPEEEEKDITEAMTEEAVSLVLLKLFSEAEVHDVDVNFTEAENGERECFIQIEAECAFQSFTLLPCTKEYMELAIGKCVWTILKELFGPVTIESVLVVPSYSERRR
jgi:hypothetical protein